MPQQARRYIEPFVERMDREQLLELQFRRFRHQLLIVATSNRFFRRFYAEAGFDPRSVETRDDIRRVPLVRKAEILADAEASPPYGMRLAVPAEDVRQVVASSGTSGTGAAEIQALTAGDLELVIRAKTFQYAWAGCTSGTVVATHAPFTMASASLWNQAALERLGCNVLRLGGLPAHERLRWMAKYGAEVTAASTSYLMRLEFAADETGLDIASALGSLRRVFVGSGGWSLDWARERVARWDAVLHESYGMSQRGFAFSCEEGVLARAGRGVLHGLPHLCLMEIVDPATGHQVVHGEEGEVVITPFGVSAMPLVRYATGDRARFMQAHACRCGRPFDGVEAGTIGRYDDMLRIREVNVWPGAIDQVVFAFPEIGDYRGELTVDSTGREIARIAVEFRGETSVEARAQGLRSVAAALRSKLHLTFLVVEHDGHALRSEDDPTMSATSLKLQRWADRRSSSRDAVSKAKLDLPPVSDS